MKGKNTKIAFILCIVAILLTGYLLARSAYIAGADKACQNTDGMYLNEDFECETWPGTENEQEFKFDPGSIGGG